MKNCREHPDLYSSLCILPEGTVTNGLGLLQFKKGPFKDFEPVKMFCSEYTKE